MPGGGRLFLVALTGYGQGEDRRRVVEAGFNLHLVKPVEYEQLLRALADAGHFALGDAGDRSNESMPSH
jgi:CheY-like chemotaxis protein